MLFRSACVIVNVAMWFPPHATAWVAVDNMLLTSRLSSAGGLNRRTKKS